MMSKETYVGGDIIETTGGNNLSYAKDVIENIGLQVIQDGKTSGVFYGINSPPPSLGNIDLIKVVINTKYDVCHDELNDNHDYKNFWILEDNGKHYHWLNTRSNPDDINKPNPLPITLGSKDNFVLKATFKTKSPIACKIRIKDSNNKYIFNEEQHPKKNANEEHEITFSCNTKPYKDTVQYFENLSLNFEYSEDGSTWMPMKNIQFCLYLTWKEPLFSSFDTTSSSTMQLKCSTNKNKENICETLLWIGCKRASGISIINEEALLDKIFDEFKSLKVIRVRETKWINEGLGYWRNASMGSFTRGLRTLLKDGEARCGEWTDFLQHILFSQGLLVGNDTIGICTEEATSYGFSTNPTIPGSYPATTPVFKPIPISFQFAVKNAIHSNTNNPNVTTGDSPGQGNPKSQPVFIDHYWFYYSKGKRFFDASYGKTYNMSESNLKKYCHDNISSVFLLNATRTLGSIATTDLHNYIRATKNLF